MSYTKGNWSVGKTGCVVSDTIPEDYIPGSGHDEIEYYGGFLICESVMKSNAKLIAAAPDLLEALKSIENDDNSIPASIWEMRNKAIKKATE